MARKQVFYNCVLTLSDSCGKTWTTHKNKLEHLSEGIHIAVYISVYIYIFSIIRHLPENKGWSCLGKNIYNGPFLIFLILLEVFVVDECHHLVIIRIAILMIVKYVIISWLECVWLTWCWCIGIMVGTVFDSVLFLFPCLMNDHDLWR